jgi:hypothetical protein
LLRQHEITPPDNVSHALPKPTLAIEKDTPNDGDDGKHEESDKNSNKSDPRVRITSKNPAHGQVEGAQRGAEVLCEFNGMQCALCFF